MIGLRDARDERIVSRLAQRPAVGSDGLPQPQPELRAMTDTILHKTADRTEPWFRPAGTEATGSGS
jgi:hypothetical protein